MLGLVSFCLLLLLFPSFLQAEPKEKIIIRRVQAHLTIGDYQAAVEEAQQGILLYPPSLSLQESLIRALARLGDEKRLLKAWDLYAQSFPESIKNRELIEEMAWGVLNKASQSSSLVMRQMALLAAFFSQEAKGIVMIHQGLCNSNYAIRTLAVKLAGHFRDHKLKEEVKHLFKSEKVWSVRQKVVEAIGNMKIIGMRADLEKIIASKESLASEKALAIASLLKLLDTINRSEIEKLASSNRFGLRQLACQAIAHFQSLRDLDQLFILAKDSHPLVRFEAFQSLGLLRPVTQSHLVLDIARSGVQDSNFQVAISAAWLLTLYSEIEGRQAFLRQLNDRRYEVRALAAAALGATGKYGIELAVDQFRTHPDKYVRLNLALGLSGQRQCIQEVTSYLSQMIVEEKENWRPLEAGLFRAIINKPSHQTEDLLLTPEIHNQLLRLELLNLLAILKATDTLQAIRNFLEERSWEISATAAALLLTEGDEAAIAIVKQLLEDPQPRIRLQAALILSLWSREESAIQTLEEGFHFSHWELKAKILEGLGRIGSMHSVPFLINILKEPSQTLRIIAAMALIQCLNH